MKSNKKWKKKIQNKTNDATAVQKVEFCTGSYGKKIIAIIRMYIFSLHSDSVQIFCFDIFDPRTVKQFISVEI